MPHLMEQVVQGPWRQEGGGSAVGGTQVEHQHHYWVLVATIRLDSSSSDGEVTVLQRLAWPSEEVTVDMSQQLSGVPHCYLTHIP